MISYDPRITIQWDRRVRPRRRVGWLDERFQLRDRSFLPNHTQIPLSQCKAIRRHTNSRFYHLERPYRRAYRWIPVPAVLARRKVARHRRRSLPVARDARRYSDWARTFTESLIGRKGWSSNRCALTWRRQDTRCSRTLFRLAVSALPTVGTDVGLLPTVQTQGLKRCVNGKMVFMPLSLLPTPTAIDAGSGRMNKSLSPNASERPTLAMASKMGLLPTPTANDAKNVTLPASQGIRNGLPKTAMQSDEYRTGTGSRLNPLYVAEMMGFPGNWLVSPFLGGAGKPSKPAETP